jgi:hypothetical protein
MKYPKKTTCIRSKNVKEIPTKNEVSLGKGPSSQAKKAPSPRNNVFSQMKGPVP